MADYYASLVFGYKTSCNKFSSDELEFLMEEEMAFVGNQNEYYSDSEEPLVIGIEMTSVDVGEAEVSKVNKLIGHFDVITFLIEQTTENKSDYIEYCKKHFKNFDPEVLLNKIMKGEQGMFLVGTYNY